MNRLHNRTFSCPVLGSWHCTRAYSAMGACRPGIPQPRYWHGTVWQGSVRFKFREEASPQPFSSLAVLTLCSQCLSACKFSVSRMHSFDTCRINHMQIWNSEEEKNRSLHVSCTLVLMYYLSTKNFCNFCLQVSNSSVIFHSVPDSSISFLKLFHDFSTCVTFIRDVLIWCQIIPWFFCFVSDSSRIFSSCLRFFKVYSSDSVRK